MSKTTIRNDSPAQKIWQECQKDIETCGLCDGTGKVMSCPHNELSQSVTCPICKGLGKNPFSQLDGNDIDG